MNAEAPVQVRVEDQNKRYRVIFGGETVADSVRTKLLFEGKYHPVIYFPLADVRQDLLTPTAHETTCPHKGVASYWSLAAGGNQAHPNMMPFLTLQFAIALQGIFPSRP